MSGRRYLRINDEKKVILANYTWEFQLHKKMDDLREKTFLPPDADLKAIHIRNSKGMLDFENKDNHWALVNLKTHDQDNTLIDDLHNQVQNLRAAGILDDKTKKITKPDIEMTLVSGDKKELKVLMAYDTAPAKDGKNKRIFATVSNRDAVFEMAPQAIEIFNRSLDEFRDRRRPLNFELTKVNAIDFNSDLLNFRIKKDKTSWQLTDADTKKEVNLGKVNDLLNKLSSLKVKQFFDDGISYQKSGMETLVLKDDQGQALLQLEWSPKVVKNLFVAKTQLAEKPFGLDTKDIESLPLKDVITDKKDKK